jgi:hypothetical protein
MLFKKISRTSELFVKSFEYEPGVCEEPPDFQLMMDIFIGKLDAIRCITVSSSRIHRP